MSLNYSYLCYPFLKTLIKSFSNATTVCIQMFLSNISGLQLGGSCGSFRLAPTLLDSNLFRSFSITIECHHTVSMWHKTTQQWRTSSAPRRWWTVSVSVESFSLYPGFKNGEFDSRKGVSLMTHPMASQWHAVCWHYIFSSLRTPIK